MNDIATLVENYQPVLQDPNEFRDTKIILFVGITGSGKNTMISELMKTGMYHDLVTTISRSPRVNNNGIMEANGVDYYFISPEEAEAKLRAGQYAEVSLVHGRIYGLTLDELRKAKSSGKLIIADLDTQGVEKLMKLSDRVMPIFVLPPTYAEWQRRAEKRYMNNEAFLAEWPKRQEAAIAELEAAIQSDKYFFLVNDEISQAVNICDSYIRYAGPNIEKEQALQIARDILEHTKVKLSI